MPTSSLLIDAICAADRFASTARFHLDNQRPERLADELSGLKAALATLEQK